MIEERVSAMVSNNTICSLYFTLILMLYISDKNGTLRHYLERNISTYIRCRIQSRWFRIHDIVHLMIM